MDKIIAIASGKGGVGKSTLAANLAVALANFDLDGTGPKRVALVDVDFYGPSIPTLMGGGQIEIDQNQKIIPALKYNVKYMSIAFFLKNPDDPVVWRGPMFGKAMQQLFHDVNWGAVDICIVDLPPGTGDAQLSLSQMIQLNGVVMVTTPQEVALSDVRRAVNMFRKVNVPILGVVENMAGFRTADGTIHDIFGSGGGQALADQYSIPFLASIPLDTDIRKAGDSGEPTALHGESTSGSIYLNIARGILKEINAEGQPQLMVQN